ncbi:predicted protein [Lichtheimia corymbifera JMRC:FSU:9682]|uniref:Uncharacterized protein n=1 Tax=Lichtheimia corymbifera JMRC:FSU:9682 TaxID=1263082 RepID=A0A068S5A2_9FUNG|nr:predicted protein [Lichtheimia corymbifera JMRC:FSU:9682]
MTILLLFKHCQQHRIHGHEVNAVSNKGFICGYIWRDMGTSTSETARSAVACPMESIPLQDVGSFSKAIAAVSYNTSNVLPYSINATPFASLSSPYHKRDIPLTNFYFPPIFATQKDHTFTQVLYRGCTDRNARNDEMRL